MSTPFVSLDAATAVGPGASKDLDGVYDHHTMVTYATGSPTSYEVYFEGSHDDSAWFGLALAQGGGSSVISRTVPDYTMPTGSGHLARYVRARLLSLSGGSSPTVTATIATDVTGED